MYRIQAYDCIRFVISEQAQEADSVLWWWILRDNKRVVFKERLKRKNGCVVKNTYPNSFTTICGDVLLVCVTVGLVYSDRSRQTDKHHQIRNYLPMADL